MNKKDILRKKLRIRARISGDSTTPRLAVYKSSKFNYAQLIDDNKQITIASVNDTNKSAKMTKADSATAIGKEIAKLAVAKKIKSVKFDRGGFIYHGRIKNIADGARSEGLEF